MIEVTINSINNYDYLLKDKNNKEYKISIELFDYNLEVNDKLYINKKLLNNNVFYRFGKIYEDNNANELDIIKVIRNKEEFYLQRYYG